MALMDRMAGAPISWGVCEVPGWGVELPPERVLSEMAELGLAATELGSDGYLPTDPTELKALVDAHNLTMIGGFVPVVVHDPAEEANTIAAVHQAASLMSPVGGTVFVSSAVTSWIGALEHQSMPRVGNTHRRCSASSMKFWRGTA